MKLHCWVVRKKDTGGVWKNPREAFLILSASLKRWQSHRTHSSSHSQNTERVLAGVAQLVGHCPVNCCRFNSQSGHMPRLWVWAPVRDAYERQPIAVSLSHQCSSPTFSLPPPLSKNQKACPQGRREGGRERNKERIFFEGWSHRHLCPACTKKLQTPRRKQVVVSIKPYFLYKQLSALLFRESLKSV